MAEEVAGQWSLSLGHRGRFYEALGGRRTKGMRGGDGTSANHLSVPCLWHPSPVHRIFAKPMKFWLMYTVVGRGSH